MQPITSRINALHLLDEMYLSKIQPANPAVVNIFNCEGSRYKEEKHTIDISKVGYSRRDKSLIIDLLQWLQVQLSTCSRTV